MLTTLVVLAALGCAKDTPRPVPEPPVVAPVPAAPAPAAPEPLAATDAAVTPQALYDACRERVEGVEADAECTTDADCAPVGCSGETCVTVEAGKGMMSTCDVQACFGVLDQCGCVQGRCSWSLKSVVPEGAALPPKPTRPGVPPIPTGPQ
jgi:eight-cysteine-cluster-containing protein